MYWHNHNIVNDIKVLMARVNVRDRIGEVSADGWVCMGVSPSTNKPFFLCTEFLLADSRDVDKREGQLRAAGNQNPRVPDAKEFLALSQTLAFREMFLRVVAGMRVEDEGVSEITFLTSTMDIVCLFRPWGVTFVQEGENWRSFGHYFDFRRCSITPAREVQERPDRRAIAVFVRDESFVNSSDRGIVGRLFRNLFLAFG